MLELCCGAAPLAASVEAADIGATVIATTGAAALAHARRNLTTSYVDAGDVTGAPAGFAARVDAITAAPP